MLLGLAGGAITRENASDWASKWVLLSDPNIKDKVVWRTLTILLGADMMTTDRPYLYGEADFLIWLDEFDSEVAD